MTTGVMWWDSNDPYKLGAPCIAPSEPGLSPIQTERELHDPLHATTAIKCENVATSAMGLSI